MLTLSRLELVMIELTNLCNLRCIMCGIREELPSRVMVLDRFAGVVGTKPVRNARAIALTGGEPFMIGNLLEHDERVRRLSPRSHVNYSTNGWYTERTVELLERVDRRRTSVTISYDGIRSHDATRRVPGSQERLLETARRVRTRSASTPTATTCKACCARTAARTSRAAARRARSSSASTARSSCAGAACRSATSAPTTCAASGRRRRSATPCARCRRAATPGPRWATAMLDARTRGALRDLRRRAGDAARALLTREIRIEFERIPLPVRNASLRKVRNWLAVEAGIALRRTEPWGLPTHAQIEPSSRCNLRCTYCPVGTETGTTGHMDPALFRDFVDQVQDHTLVLTLWGWGEPFVCPSVYEMIAYAHAKGIRVPSSTNGRLFVKPEHADGVVRSGLDALIVSLSGTTQEAYRRFRAGRLETALDGVREIVAAKRRLGSRAPHVQISLIVTDYSEKELPGLRDLARSLGVDGLSLKRMNTASVKPGPNRVDEALPEDLRLRRFTHLEDGVTRLRVKDNPCKALWHNPTVRWDGTINPCVYDFDGAHVLGDLRREPFAAIWSGGRYADMRRRFRKGWEGIDICSRCTYAFAGGNYTDVVTDTWFFPENAVGAAAAPRQEPSARPDVAGELAG